MAIERISLQWGVAAYTQGQEIPPLDLETAIENLPSEKRKELKKAAIKIKAQKQDTESPEDLVNRVIFGCKVLLLGDLFGGRRRWLKTELWLLKKKLAGGFGGDTEDAFIVKLKAQTMWLMSLWAQAEAVILRITIEE